MSSSTPVPESAASSRSTVSDNPAIVGENERKDEVRARVRAAGGDAAAVYVADKISKVRELRALLANGVSDEEAATRFQWYRKLLAMLDEVIPGSRLTELLRFELETLETQPPGHVGQGTSRHPTASIRPPGRPRRTQARHR